MKRNPHDRVPIRGRQAIVKLTGSTAPINASFFEIVSVTANVQSLCLQLLLQLYFLVFVQGFPNRVCSGLRYVVPVLRFK
jgi:hypothetical protein